MQADFLNICSLDWWHGAAMDPIRVIESAIAFLPQSLRGDACTASLSHSQSHFLKTFLESAAPGEIHGTDCSSII
jgi:hypothetical protein